MKIKKRKKDLSQSGGGWRGDSGWNLQGQEKKNGGLAFEGFLRYILHLPTLTCLEILFWLSLWLWYIIFWAPQ